MSVAKHSVADEATVDRLQQEIARDRLRLAQAIALASDLPAIDESAGEPARVGRLHRIFTLMGEC
jgi:hypothetical protein